MSETLSAIGHTTLANFERRVGDSAAVSVE